MRKWQILTSIFALLVVGDEAKAGDKEDVLAHMASFYSAFNAGDVDGIPFSTHTRYDVKGGLIQTADAEKNKAWAKGAFASGLKINVQSFHENVEVYGKTAVFTCYQRVNIKLILNLLSFENNLSQNGYGKYNQTSSAKMV